MPACGGDGTLNEEATHGQEGHSHTHSHDVGAPTENFRFTLGEPGDEADAARRIEIEALGGFRFSPAKLEVERGETVTFQLTNADRIQHEFVLGNEAYQELHNRQATTGGVYHDYSAYSLHVRPEETMSLTWRFDRSGVVEFACHVEGHYEQGMVGRIRVS